MKNALFIGAILFQQLCFGQGENWLLNKIEENREYCVQEIHKNKVYLHQDCVDFIDQKHVIYLNDFECFALPLILEDVSGYFIATRSLNSELSAKKARSQGPCPSCSKMTDSNGCCKNDACLFCGMRVIQR